MLKRWSILGPAQGLGPTAPRPNRRGSMPLDFRAQIAARLQAAKASPAWANYQRVRDYICTMMDDWERLDPDGGPSAYWKEEVEGFLYMFDASPLIIEALRDQCYHLTGIRSYEYRSHHTHRLQEFADKYAMLKAVDSTGLFVPEAPDLGGFGFDLPDGKVNIDTLKFYEIFLGLDRAGVLKKKFIGQPDRRVVLEIGSGWGGFGHQFKTLYPNTTYISVDLPPTLMFAGLYSATTFPNARTLFYGEPDFEAKVRNIKAYDFVFLPHYYFPQLQGQPLDLAINMASFQEMTTAQVEGYIRQLKEFGCKRIYSMNRDRSKHNSQLTAVSEILGKYYNYQLIKVLDIQYTQMKPPSKPPKEMSIHDYRHYFGWA
jgi:hypothetical protein